MLLKDSDGERLSARDALSHEWFKLDLKKEKLDHLKRAMDLMKQRKKSKIYNINQFKHLERLSISQLDKDLLRFGLECGHSPTDLKRFSSLKGGADDILVELHHTKVDIGQAQK